MQIEMYGNWEESVVKNLTKHEQERTS